MVSAAAEAVAVEVAVAVGAVARMDFGPSCGTALAGCERTPAG